MFRTKSHDFDGDLLARHLAQRLQQADDAGAMLSQLRAELPAVYHAAIDQLADATRRTGSLAIALTTHPNSHLRLLGSWLNESSELPLVSRLTQWQQRASLLLRVAVRVHQEGNERLTYFATLSTVFCLVCVMWLQFVAPAYSELFESIAPGSALPSMSLLMIKLSASEHVAAVVLKSVILILPFIIWALVFALRHQLNRLRRGQELSTWLVKIPALNRLSALRTLLLTPETGDISVWEHSPLLNNNEILGLKLAKTGNYLHDEQAQLLALPESMWAERTIAPLRRATMIATTALWGCIAFFLVASYQPIFQLGAAV